MMESVQSESKTSPSASPDAAITDNTTADMVEIGNCHSQEPTLIQQEEDSQSVPEPHISHTQSETAIEQINAQQNESPPPSKNSNSPPKRRIIRRTRRSATRQVADDDAPPLMDPVLYEKVMRESNLPSAYSFEIPKTVQRIQALHATHVALQLPEGLLLYATVLGDILKQLAAPVLQHISVLGDVTYGACCIDDLTAHALGCQLLIHYGHSCLVPLQHTVVPCLYVFVEIQFDIPHMVACVVATLQAQEQEHHTPPPNNIQKPPSRFQTHIYLLGTIQFRHCFGEALQLLQQEGYAVSIPQVKPLSPGEVLGCTSPLLEQPPSSSKKQPGSVVSSEEKILKEVVCFVADGRFHLESTLISNPHIHTFYRYDPYSKTLTEESYNHRHMKELRSHAIQQAHGAQTMGIILGTLGRQGNPAIVQRIQTLLHKHHIRSFVLLLSEITPAKLKLFAGNVDSEQGFIDAWVQVACPRLSVDWGHYLSPKPVLSPYELFVSLGETEERQVYPMDYYSYNGGPWSNYHPDNKDRSWLAPLVLDQKES